MQQGGQPDLLGHAELELMARELLESLSGIVKIPRIS